MLFEERLQDYCSNIYNVFFKDYELCKLIVCKKRRLNQPRGGNNHSSSETRKINDHLYGYDKEIKTKFYTKFIWKNITITRILLMVKNSLGVGLLLQQI